MSSLPVGNTLQGAMRFSWPHLGEPPAPSARGQGDFEISVQFMTGRLRTRPKRADKHLPWG